MVGIIPEIIDPEYTYIKYDAKFDYNKSLTTQTPSDLRTTIKNYLSLFSRTRLSKFGRDLYINELEELCRNLESSLLYVDVDIKLQKRLSPTLNKKLNYIINFHNELLNTIHDAPDGVSGFPAVQSFRSRSDPVGLP